MLAELLWDAVDRRVARSALGLALRHFSLELLHFDLGLARLAGLSLRQQALNIAKATLGPGIVRRWLTYLTCLVGVGRFLLLLMTITVGGTQVVIVCDQGDVGRRVIVSRHVQVADLGRILASARVHVVD